MWPEFFSRLRALELLDKVIEDPMPLFQGQAWVLEDRRLAWLYRIELLRECGKQTRVLNIGNRAPPTSPVASDNPDWIWLRDHATVKVQ